MKKLLTGLLAAAVTLGTAAVAPVFAAEKTEITLWTYPIGAWSKAETVDRFVKNFNEAHPEIAVHVEYLDYKTGDDKVTTAIETKTMPDLIFEGPERLVSNWGAKGLMVDLKELWTDEAKKDIGEVSEAVVKACQSTKGEFFEYPMVMTTHEMAINKEVFEKADALQYLDLEKHTWTTENFQKALEALKKSGQAQNLIVYCGGQGGDQGTRALVNNLYHGKYTNAEHSAYTMDSPENIKALTLLKELADKGLVTFDTAAQAADELQYFANGTVAMTLAWNASNAANYADKVQFTPVPMNFPSEDGKAELCGGIWGFGIFNKGDEAKVKAAKEFIKFIVQDKKQGPESVKATGFFPVHKSQGNVYADLKGDEKTRMETFAAFLPNLGDYYNVTGGWVEQRTAWWNMLQKIANGEDVKASAEEFVKTANAAAKK